MSFFKEFGLPLAGRQGSLENRKLADKTYSAKLLY